MRNQHSNYFRNDERDIAVNGRRRSDGQSQELKERQVSNTISVSLPSIRASAASIIKQPLEDRAYYKMAMA